MDIESKISVVTRKPACEVLTEDELREVFQNYSQPKHYIGFEISGLVHIGSGLVTAVKVRDFLEAGIKPTIFLADYHAWINGKLGGDLEKIQYVAKGYFKSAFVSLGLDEERVNYILASEIYNGDYWKDVLNVCSNTTIARMLRCTTIMGRTQKEAVSSSSIIYPAMQAADIFLLDVQIAHAGIDQRKVHILTREICEKMKRKKPVALHHKLLSGLQGPQKMGLDENEQLDLEISSKMSKSKPASCIYIHDSEEEIKKKIGGAYCPPKIAEANPILDICENLILRTEKDKLNILRPAKFGGDAEYADFASLANDYSEGKLHPADLKGAVAEYLIGVFAPSREYFEKNKEMLRI
ncbi:tyrosine--tRNA ligase [Candidatus Micrarchaeota archaeon CG11_big_fil_rev_8_21_14_0_20_47_5]|nr:MAG: tyrosine--tRNA ligase [Candidatus Micrarchaeota archaeon CG1_02_47_40]PIN84085.1 MAG: tyrosine--tRNA ligase [Candidatus Micrarchaeota archaeon CG11_big_fil_rev_8_21_14_0_20_47_5]